MPINYLNSFRTNFILNQIIQNVFNASFSTIVTYNKGNEIAYSNNVLNNTATPLDHVCANINKNYDNNCQMTYYEKEINKAFVSAVKQAISDSCNKGVF